MKCPADPALLVDYASGRLAPARAADLGRHIETCDFCAERVPGYSAISEALDTWDSPPVSLDFNRRLWSKIDAAQPVRWTRRLFPAIPVAAAAAMMLAGLWMERPHASPQVPAPGVSVVEAEQAERALDDIQLLRGFDDALSDRPQANTM